VGVGPAARLDATADGIVETRIGRAAVVAGEAAVAVAAPRVVGVVVGIVGLAEIVPGRLDVGGLVGGTPVLVVDVTRREVRLTEVVAASPWACASPSSR
jgi:hypothetical protein